MAADIIAVVDCQFIKGKKMLYFHKCTAYGLRTIINWEFEQTVLCCSSEKSKRLFWRDVCIVVDIENANIVKEHHYDIDSKIESLYDEVRISLDYQQFLSSVKMIVVTSKYLRKLRAGITTSPEAFPPLPEFYGLSHEKCEKKSIQKWWATIETRFPIKTVKQSGFTEEFLNLV